MVNIKMIANTADLEKETGLDRNGLWDAGFNLDDWDACFVSDVCLCKTEIDEDGDRWVDPIDDAYWLVRQMENYCVGFEEVELNGKWYYTVHHA